MSWLFGPIVDAWLRVSPQERQAARELLPGLVEQLGEACLGSLSGAFAAEAPCTRCGCCANAWSVIELPPRG